MLLRVSEMVCELPWLREMDINPLIVDETRRGRAGRAHRDRRTSRRLRDRYDHMAIHPYPAHLVQTGSLPDGAERHRSARSGPKTPNWSRNSSRTCRDEAKYFRFMNTLRELTQTHAGALHPDRLRPRNGLDRHRGRTMARKWNWACAATPSIPTANPASSPWWWPTTGSTAGLGAQADGRTDRHRARARPQVHERRLPRQQRAHAPGSSPASASCCRRVRRTIYSKQGVLALQ
ncbi:MAG: acetate--CoA ligase family protein [Comamonadaceae bacterium]|nr:acetate--CoA ligase family protein [Comamonadaceae bacterium]